MKFREHPFGFLEISGQRLFSDPVTMGRVGDAFGAEPDVVQEQRWLG